MLSYYNNSHINLITNVYNEYNWLTWKFKVVPDGYWNNEVNVKKYMNWLSEKLNIKSMEDWYNVSTSDFKNNYGYSLVQKYGQYIRIITTIYNNHNWLPWKFKVVSDGYWQDENNVKKYLNWLSEKLNIKSKEDWYNVSSKDFIDNRGNTLLIYYGNSHIKLLMSVYNDYNWLPWKFTKLPQGYWKDIENRKNFMNYLSTQLKIKDYTEWYNVTFHEISQYGGEGLTDQYKSIAELFMSIYPDYKWDVYKFNKLPNGHIKLIQNSPSHQQEFIEYLIKQFNIKQTSDWYLVTTDRIMEVITMDLSTLMKLVKKHYPDLDMNYFSHSHSLVTKKAQYLLKSMLKELFPNQEILEDYRHPDLDYLELDYYLPDLKLAFEYQVIIIMIIEQVKIY